MKCRFPLHAALATLAGTTPVLAYAGGSLFGDRTEIAVGAALAYVPRYAGADTGFAMPVPVLSIQRGILFADTTRGAGLQYEASSGLYVSQSFFYDLGRLDKDSTWRPGSDRLAGMGRVPASATARTLAAMPLTPKIVASIDAELTLRDSARRNRFRTGIEFTPIKTANDALAIAADAWWGDSRYNRAYFGVSPTQVSHTGMAAFKPGNGLYARSLGVSWEHRFDSQWAATLQLTGTHYTGEARNSPLLSHRTNGSATAVLTYHY